MTVTQAATIQAMFLADGTGHECAECEEASDYGITPGNKV